MRQNTTEHRTKLRQLRARCIDREGRTKVRQDGIYLVVRFRTEPDAQAFAELVRSLGGDVDEIGKVRKARETGDLTWVVVFSIGIDEDIYLVGGATMRELEEWHALDEARKGAA